MYPDHQVQLDHADSRALPVATAWMVFPVIPVPEEVKVHQVEQVVLDCLEPRDLLVKRATKETAD